VVSWRAVDQRVKVGFVVGPIVALAAMLAGNAVGVAGAGVLGCALVGLLVGYFVVAVIPYRRPK
jgi:hypothetical protein